MNHDGIILEIASLFMEMGAGPDVFDDLNYERRKFWEAYNKFSKWAYDNSTHMPTSFRVGKVRREENELVADVYISSGDIETLALRVRYQL